MRAARGLEVGLVALDRGAVAAAAGRGRGLLAQRLRVEGHIALRDAQRVHEEGLEHEVDGGERRQRTGAGWRRRWVNDDRSLACDKPNARLQACL